MAFTTHIALADERLSGALAKNIPFARTWCNSVAKLASLSAVPELATCPGCRAVLAEVQARAASKHSATTRPLEGLPPLEALDETEDFFSGDIDLEPRPVSSSSKTPPPKPSEPKPAPNPFEELEAKMAEAKAILDWMMPMLLMAVPDKPHPDSLVFFDPSLPDPKAFRSSLSVGDAMLLQTWYEASSSMGLTPLWTVVGSVLAHQVENLRTADMDDE